MDDAEILALLGGYLARRLRYHEALGEIAPGELWPGDIVDEAWFVARRHGTVNFPTLRAFADRLLLRRLDHLRGQRRALERDLTRHLHEVLPDPHHPPPDDVAAELQRALALLVGELPEDEREPLMLTAMDWRSVDEVAVLEQLPCDEVRRRIAAGTEHLRLLLAREYGAEPPPDVGEILRVMVAT
jgi:DNA-directed RNA polymerase specialized sigma24 family protein